MGSFSTDEASLSEGLRAAVASAAMLLLGNILDNSAFSWAAIGAFWTCLADAAGTNRMRLASMMGFAILSTLCGALTAYASGAGTLAAAAAILVFSSVGALARIWGAAASQVEILAATACVVMVDRPLHSVREGVPFLLIYLSGCIFATALSFTVWRIHPFAPARFALRAAYFRLGDMIRDSARLLALETTDFDLWATHAASFRGRARAAIETARNRLANVPASRTERRESYESLLIALADTERIFAYLIAVTDACARGHHHLVRPGRAIRTLSVMAEVLRRIGKAITDEPSTPPVAHLQHLHALARKLETALGELLTLRLSSETLELDHAHAQRHTWFKAGLQVVKRSWGTLKANASSQSTGLRHAARVGIATTAGFLIVREFHLPFGYWATMATLLVLQPSIATTWPRSAERAAGSIVGGLLAALIGLVVHSPLAVSLTVIPLICATMALRRVNYSLFVLFLTPTFVLVADFATPGANEFIYAVARLGNNVLGCAIALLATFFLWPAREPDFDNRLADAVSANLAYLAGALAAGSDNERKLERLRRAAGLASNNAEEAYSRLRLERLSRTATERSASTSLALLRRVAGTATRIRSHHPGTGVGGALVLWVSSVSQEINARLHKTLPSSPFVPYTVDKLTVLEADAVGEITLLRRLLVERADDDDSQRAKKNV
jgi:uncharacterized membrane protein YccC